MQLRVRVGICGALLMLAACNQQVQPMTTAQNTATTAPSFAVATSPTQTQSVATPIPLGLLLADFPLSVGTVWEYSAEISYQDPNDHAKTVTWSGSVTDTVISQKGMPSDSSMTFTMQETLTPTPPQDVWRQSSTFEYTLSGNTLSEGGSQILQWPLASHTSWQAFTDFPSYNVQADYIGGVDEPYGHFEHCWNLITATNPDVKGDVFCRGIGLVEHNYRHFGTPQVEHFRLIKFRPGQIAF